MNEGEHYETKGAALEGRTSIATAMLALRLVAITADDADAFYDLIDRNRTHLTRHGDWTDLGAATPESVHARLSNLDGRNAQFGIWLDGRLIGRTDLNARTPGNVVLSYWLGGEFTGKGYATAACKALIAYGKAELGVRNDYAGVTKGNVKSEALLCSLEFKAIEDRDTYTLFRLSLVQVARSTIEQMTKSEEFRANKNGRQGMPCLPFSNSRLGLPSSRLRPYGLNRVPP